MSLLEAATKVRENAYAPYSRFKVGAALRAASGAVYTGVQCRKRGLSRRHLRRGRGDCGDVAAGERQIAEIVVIADSPEPVPCCGGCRQKIAEFAAPEVRVTMATLDGKTRSVTVAELLPGVFTAAHMDRA
jgi:cytidine deaminase